MKKKHIRLRGVTIVEVIVATVVSAFVLTGLFGSLGSIYFSQKKISATQRFSSETRFLMERAVQAVRNNTLDYDRFFVEIGPSCGSFDAAQVPEGALTTNDKENRENLGYETIFYWDVVDEGGDRSIRNLGGKKPDVSGEDVIDPCAEAWNGVVNELYLINEERTERTAIRLDVVSGRIQMQRMLGADTTGDRQVDSWGLSSTWDDGAGQCNIFEDTAKALPIANPAFGISSESECADIYDWVDVSPLAIEVLNFEFIPGPNRDPFLNYRIDEAQVHPQVFVRLKTKIRHPENFGLDYDEQIELTLQTTASSRVYGDSRQ